MTTEDSNLVSLDERRRALGLDTSHSRRAAAEKNRWLEIWGEAWNLEEQRRGKCISHSDRLAFAARVRMLVSQIQDQHGARSGRITAALDDAAVAAADPELARQRGCPARLLSAVTKTREYRIDRFTAPDPKMLRGKLADWLWVVEALARTLGRDFRREVMTLYEARNIRVSTDRAVAGLAEEYDAVFASLSGRLSEIAAAVAREHDVAAYYECCDKLHAAWHDGSVIESDGWAQRFNRYDFADAGWVEANDGSYWEDVAARSPLGPVGELIIHTPLARVSLCFVETDEAMRADGFPGEWASMELDIHLALRPDADDPRQCAALLLHPFIAVHDAELGTEKADRRWWRVVPQVALDPVDEQWKSLLREAVPPPYDQHHERAARLAAEHSGGMRLLPMSGDACQAWLSFGANPEAPLFDAFFWHDTSAVEVDPRAVVSAPFGTLAGHIQFNLIMAAAAEEFTSRIDQLLAADAARKVAAMQRLLAQKKAAYEQRLDQVLLSRPTTGGTDD